MVQLKSFRFLQDLPEMLENEAGQAGAGHVSTSEQASSAASSLASSSGLGGSSSGGVLQGVLGASSLESTAPIGDASLEAARQADGLTMDADTSTTDEQTTPAADADQPQLQQQQQAGPYTTGAAESGKLAAFRERTLSVSSNLAAGQLPGAPSGNQFEIRWFNVHLQAPEPSRPLEAARDALRRLMCASSSSSSPSPKPADGSSPSTAHSSPPLAHLTLAATPTSLHGQSAKTQAPGAGQTPPDSVPSSPTSSKKAPDSATFPATAERRAPRTILNNLSGAVSSGQLTAILGPSGVGKTSLLNSLTGRNTLEGSGRVALIGGRSDTKRVSVATVPQADVLPDKLTTLEDLQFTSRLKNAQPKFDHKRNIDRIVKHLQMEKFLHTRIDRLSGGEARRLSIGRELLKQPDILILDEPTSGLDANTCKKIIQALRDIVEHSDHYLDRPMSIIVTIHQPQQEVLNLFHRVYVMAMGGRAIFEGAPSLLRSTLLERSSLAQVCPQGPGELNENPAIVAIEVASGEYGPQVIDELARYQESQHLDDFWLYGNAANLAAAAVGESPFLTPRSLRLPAKSPQLSVSPRIELLQRQHRSRSPAGSPRTPSVSRKPANQPAATGGAASPAPGAGAATGAVTIDGLSQVGSLVSWASTWDAELPEPTSKLHVDKRLRRSVVMKSHFCVQTLTLMQRCWLLTTRNMFLMAIRVIGFLLVAAGVVQIFSHALDPNENQCPNYTTEVDDVLEFMQQTKERLINLTASLKQMSSTHLFFFHVVLCIAMVTSALEGLVFPIQMRMFVREYKNGWYSPASFVTSQTLAQLPIDIIGPTLTMLIVYPLCHQPVSAYYWREIGYIVILNLTSVCCKSQAQIVGALLMDSVENSVFVSCVLVAPQALLSGVAVRIHEMPLLLQWFSFGSFLRYAFEGLFALRYGFGMCPCDPDRVHGYPTGPSPSAIPLQLDNLARGLLDLNGVQLPGELAEPTRPPNTTVSLQTTPAVLLEASLAPTSLGLTPAQADANIFVRFLRLVTDASNLFAPNLEELGDCERYRSLHLLDMSLDDRILPKWLLVLFILFVLSRFLTYFVVKTVIKMRRQ